MPAIDIKRVAADTHLTTDVMILDHLIHKATKAILNEITEKDVDKSNRRLHRVNDFLLIFNANHQQRLDIPDTQFRLQLLQFATLFFAYRSSNARLPPMRSVAALRQQNEARASKWDQPNEGNVDEALSSTTTLQSKGLLLLDILPLFMRLSIQIAHDPPSEAWMRLAVAFMQYAVVEAICSVASSHEKVKRKTFRFNSLRGKIVREAFIWGSPKTSDGGDDDEAEFHDVLSMEGGGPGSTVRKWRD
ncbi:Hypothetical protein D9617_26g078280 [Elsinoe fawcettii]|nr:Hypothetical protein D9617_26g078280 [Elsinoe fawcettii]